MSRRSRLVFATSSALLMLSACSTKGGGDGVQSVGETLVDGAKGLAGSAVSLVNVDLSNVLNDLALDLHIDRANIPINAQIPISLAANICGVSINILSVSGGSPANCTATTASPELVQAVQQQLAANGSVGGGAQSTQSPTTSTVTTTPTTTTTTPPPTTADPQQPQR